MADQFKTDLLRVNHKLNQTSQRAAKRFPNREPDPEGAAMVAQRYLRDPDALRTPSATPKVKPRA